MNALADMLQTKMPSGGLHRTFGDPMSDLQVAVIISRPNGQSLEDLCCHCTMEVLHRLDKTYKPEEQVKAYAEDKSY